MTSQFRSLIKKYFPPDMLAKLEIIANDRKISNNEKTKDIIDLLNDYNVPLLYMPTKPTLAYAVFQFSQDYSNKYSVPPVKIAGGMFLAVPILIIFICLKDKLMGNISLGGLKE